jgi:hypothetical protein
VQEGRGGYGAHTVKNWCAGRARGTQGRDRNKKAGGKKEKKDFWSLDPSRKSTAQPKTLRVYIRTTCTSGKGLYGHKRSTCELYRNIVSTRVCANNFFSVGQNGSVVVPWHYRARIGNRFAFRFGRLRDNPRCGKEARAAV